MADGRIFVDSDGNAAFAIDEADVGRAELTSIAVVAGEGCEYFDGYATRVSSD